MRFEDLAQACANQDAQGIARAVRAGMSVNRRGSCRRPLWQLLLEQDRREDLVQPRMQACLRALWAGHLRLDRENNDGHNLVDYLFFTGNKGVALFLMALPGGRARIQKQVSKLPRLFSTTTNWDAWWAGCFAENDAARLAGYTCLAEGDQAMRRL